MPNQYDNEINVLAHYETTDPRIHEQTLRRSGRFRRRMGTGGTLMGTGKY